MNNQKRQERGPAGAIGAILGLIAVGVVVAAALAKRRSREDRDTGGLENKGSVLDEANSSPGAAIEFKMPEDMRAVIPEPPSYAPA